MFEPVTPAIATTANRRTSDGEGCKAGKRRSSLGVIGSPSAPSQASSCAPGSPGSSSSDAEVDFGRPRHVPDVALPMQHALLKRISTFQSKEELLEFVAHYHMLLDPINLVTCLYRLAKMSKEASRGRGGYLAELQRNPTFQLLLRSISGKFLQGHLNYLHTQPEGLKGVDGRCLANLTWALAKLDLSSDDSALTTELALTLAPFIIRSLDTSSPQGLANMLWSYAKLPVAPPSVVMALVAKITDQLVLQSQRPDGAGTFDAQALSNSIWALAHLKSRGMDVDGLRCPQVLRFMNELAAAAARALARPHAGLPAPGSGGQLRVPEAQRYLALVEREFSCQALVNIAWSFATLLGTGCCQQPAIHQLFLLIHSESLARLRCTALALGAGAPLPYVGGGGFNEQALSNAVYAFDKVGLLSSELLGCVFEVSALRLQRGAAGRAADLASFKPQELCTLLKAAHTNIAPPWRFLGSLLQLLSSHPAMADAWTAAERLELHRACQLYLAHQGGDGQGAAMSGQGPLDAGALSAALGVAHSLAGSIGAPPGPGSTGRQSGTGSGLPSPSPGYGTPPGSSGGGGFFHSRRPSGGAGGFVAPPGSGGLVGPSLGGLLGEPGAAGGRRRSNSNLGMPPAGQVPHSGDMLISTFGQLPLALDRQQQQQQQPRAWPQSAALAPADMGGVLACPLCGTLLAQQSALGHIEACLMAANSAAAANNALMQQQQAQLQAAAAARLAGAHQQALLIAQLRQQQQQAGLFNMSLQQAQQQQAAQQQAVLGQPMGGLLQDLCRPAGALEQPALAPWTLEAAARPPLRPAQRL